MKSPEDLIRAVGGTSTIYAPEPKLHSKPNGTVGDDQNGIEFRRLQPIGAAKIAPRPWAYGKFLLFGAAAVIGAVDGAGKGAIAVTMMLAQITGKPLLGERVWRTGPVGVVSYEDDEEEWHRRIAAACIHHQVDYERVVANIHFIHRARGRVVFAQMHNGVPLFPDGDTIIDGVKKRGIVLLIIDPFNSAHSMDDGNNNVMIARVAVEISRIARESRAAALVLHHLRKGATGDLDDLMGATSLRANFRSTRVLTRMTAEEASALKVSFLERWRYLRIAGVKANYAPPPEQATWFRLASQDLGNGADIYPDGDNLGVATTWEPPKAFDGVGLAEMRAIFEQLRAGPGDGWHYSPAPKAKYWVGKVIMDVAGNSRQQATTVVDTWTTNGVLHKAAYTTPNRDTGTRVTLNEEKIAEMLGPKATFDERSE